MAHVHTEEDDYESLPNSSLSTNMIAGAIAGITEHVVTYPLDVLKTRKQFFSSTDYTQSIKLIYHKEGWKSLWRGVNSIFMGAGPAHALYFGSYEAFKDVFKSMDDSEHQHLSHASAGLMATIAHDGFLTPFDVIKQRMQLNNTYRGVFDCVFKVYKAEGLSAFYVSYPVTLLMSMPFQALQFTTYEYCRKKLNPSGAYDPLTHSLAGATAGAVAASITNPLDVAKTLLQTRGLATDSAIRHMSGLGQAFSWIYKREGLLGFTRGMQARILCHVPSTAVSWTTYEFLKMTLS